MSKFWQSRYSSPRVKGILCEYRNKVNLVMLIDLLGILELVRPHCLVPIGSCGRRNRISWFDGDLWSDLQLPKSNSRPSRYSQRLRHARSSVQWFDSMGNLHVRSILPCYIDRL
jgi:hypothetical protein